MRCWVSMVCILSLSPAHTGYACEIGPGLDFFKAPGLQQFAHRGVLPQPVLEKEPAPLVETRMGAGGDFPDGIEAIRTGDQGFLGLEAKLREVRIAGRYVRWIGDNQVEALLRHRAEPVAQAKI